MSETTSGTPIYDATVEGAEVPQQQPEPQETEDGPTFADVADEDPDQPAEEVQADDE